MKTLFQQLGKPTRQVAKEIGCSKTTLLGVINHGVYPKRNGTALRAQIQDYFKQHGIDVSGSLKPAPIPEKDTEMLLRKSALSQATRQHFGMVRDPFNDEIQSAQDIFLTPDVRYVREAMF
ncbi:hypothetical protein QDY72_09630 [Kingella negevensis]|nr:hypothetical protein [Kingella negevensis]MDK4685414.1 hypothetical protein [Kingella negevensis]